MKKLMIVLGSFALFVTSCSREEIQPKTQKENVVLSEKKSTVMMSPGEIHNYYLHQFYLKLKSEINQNGFDEMDFVKCSDMYQKMIHSWREENTFRITATGEKMVDYINSEKEAVSIAKCIEEIKINQNISDELKGFLENFLNSTLDANDQNTVNKIVEMGKDAANDLKGVEKEIALGTVDVFEKSVDYWLNNQLKWKQLQSPNFDENLDFPGSIGGADAGGFAVGAAIGLAGGTAVLPGVGTVTDWLGCGTAGGLINSASAAISELYDWITGS